MNKILIIASVFSLTTVALTANNTYNQSNGTQNLRQKGISQQLANKQTNYRNGASRSYIAMNTDRDHKPSDEQIRTEIDKELKGSWFESSYDTVTVKVKDGKVTLTGIVHDNEDLKNVEKRISNIRGVRMVRNNLVVATGNNNQAARASDKDLKKLINNELKNSWWGNYPNINVTVEEGVVILDGRIQNASNLEDIQDRLSDIQGIRVIRSRLTVEENNND